MKSNLYTALLLALFAISICLAGVASANDIELEIVSEEEPQGQEDYQTYDSTRERPKTGKIESQGPDLDTLIEQFGTYTDGDSG